MTKFKGFEIDLIELKPMKAPEGGIFFLGDCPVCGRTINLRQLKEHCTEMNDDRHIVCGIMES
jgi:hypothetical protein